MKKCLKVMVVLLVLVLPILAIGCGNRQAKNEKVENSNAAAAKKAEVADATSQNATNASQEGAKNAKPKVRDPYEAFVVSEEWAIENNAAVVERDGKLYSVGGFLPEDTVEKYGFGCYIEHRGSCDMVYIYAADVDSVPNDPFVPGRRDLISLGDFPTFTVKRGESARVYNNPDYLPKQVNLVPTEMLGYTIRAFLRYGSGINDLPVNYLPVLNDTIARNQIFCDNGGVFDMSENPVVNVRDLTYGQNYKFEYYTDTKYSELIMPADCIVYRYNGKNAKEGTVVPVELTKNGYAEFRFDVEPGIYYMEVMSMRYSVIEVE